MSTVFQAVMPQFGRVLPRHTTAALSLNLSAPKQRRASSGITYQVATPRKPESSPLSAMPASTLLRSLLVATISAKPYLLRPSLAFLTWLTRSEGGLFWNVERNPLLRASLKNTFYKQFCGGESMTETKEHLRRMKALGYRGTMLQNAKETVFDYNSKTAHGLGLESAEDGDASQCKSIKAWGESTLDTASVLGDGDILAFKFTGGGPLVTAALSAGRLPPKPLMDIMHEVCKTCKEKNVRILIDAESQHYQKGIFLVGMELARKYNRDGYAMVYNTYQAYLKSTPETISRHLEDAADGGFTLGLKLVRGAYMASDDRGLIHDTKQETDDAYNNISQAVIKRRFGKFGEEGGAPFPAVDLFLASHNKASLVAAQKTHQDRASHGLPTVRLDFGQLQGMSDTLSLGLIQNRNEGAGVVPNVYKCSTWGTLRECLAYLMRRAAENKDAVSRTTDEYAALKREVKRRLGFSSSTVV